MSAHLLTRLLTYSLTHLSPNNTLASHFKLVPVIRVCIYYTQSTKFYLKKKVGRLVKVLKRV